MVMKVAGVLVSRSQAAFILGRTIADDIMLADEMLHGYDRDRTNRKETTFLFTVWMDLSQPLLKNICYKFHKYSKSRRVSCFRRFVLYDC